MNVKQVHEGYNMIQIKLVEMKTTRSEMTNIYIERRTAVTSASLYKRLYKKKQIKFEEGEER